MAFTLTKYLHPIENPIVLSGHYNYVLDNPRTEDEIQLVRRFVFKTLDRRDGDRRVMPLIGRASYALDTLKEWQDANEPDNFATQYINANNHRPTIDYLCKIWIIIRFDDDEIFNELKGNDEGLIHTLMTRRGKEYEEKFERLSNYCHLLSVLGHQNEEFWETTYHGESFLLVNDPYAIFFTSYSDDIYNAVEKYTGFNSLADAGNRVTSWLYWQDGSSYLIEQGLRLDTLIPQPLNWVEGPKKPISQKQTPKQKLEHVGSIFNSAFKLNSDPKIMLLLLVSIIEFLLTRNPDTSKFNVEDSIGKQFKLKCALVVHNQNKTIDLKTINDKLKKIYNQRSDVAHGNYNDGFDIREVVNSVYDLYVFLKCILREYIDDRDVIEFAKDN